MKPRAEGLYRRKLQLSLQREWAARFYDAVYEAAKAGSDEARLLLADFDMLEALR